MFILIAIVMIDVFLCCGWARTNSNYIRVNRYVCVRSWAHHFCVNQMLSNYIERFEFLPASLKPLNSSQISMIQFTFLHIIKVHLIKMKPYCAYALWCTNPSKISRYKAQKSRDRLNYYNDLYCGVSLIHWTSISGLSTNWKYKFELGKNK